MVNALGLEPRTYGLIFVVLDSHQKELYFSDQVRCSNH